MRKKKFYTKVNLVDKLMSWGLSRKQALFTATVFLTPRRKSDRGDCRGNVAAQDHLWYNAKLERKYIKGFKEPQKFQLRWRTQPMVPRKRLPKEAVEFAKTHKSSRVKKTTVKSKSKVKS